ncbi:lipopolysaccharide assembly protein LapB [Streptomyces sp. ms184]|uniref:tetratricopeptide repeat protein n=1 Tax=Streptomyces sp. ms184 TaxID=1827974 RepID=UPI00117F2356|nr:tetratricopeptide repeat protein [Streptomyces sp. ms184]
METGPSSQNASAHDHGTAFQQGHGIQIYYASKGDKSPEGLANTAHLLTLDSAPKLAECQNPVSFGVHPAATWNANMSPDYVRRDIEEDIYALLRPGAFVMLVGDPTSGKSRTGYEVIKNKFPDYRVFRPEDGVEFNECAAFSKVTDKVIWLDELDKFLSPPNLSTGSLDEALRSGAVIVGTMRSDQMDLLSPRYERGRNQESRALVRAARTIAARAHILFMDRQWSAEEVGRARTSSDPRVSDASRHAKEYGIAEYLAAGPQLYLEWQNAWAPGLHPRGAALVSAAVDLMRAGIREAVPREKIELLHASYLEQRGGIRLRPEPILDAFHWALEPLHATSSLLVPVQEDMYKAFEYLAEAVARDGKGREVPDEVWATAVEDFPPEIVHSVGHRAEKASRHEYAERAYERLASAGIHDGAFHLGYLAAKQDELEKADFWYRKAISQGSSISKNNLGLVLVRSGREDEGALWFREAAGEGDIYAMRNLGHYLLKRSLWDEARQLFLSLMEKASSIAKTLMGQLCIRQKNYQGAEEWLQQAIGEGDKEAWFFLGVAQEEQRNWESASSSYRRAMESGNEEAVNNLAGTLHNLGNLAEAEALYRSRLDQAEDQYVVFNLARLLSETARYDEAEILFRRAIESGSQHSKNNLALMLERLGRNEEADELFREAAAEGDIRAMANLANRCRKNKRPHEALRWINKVLASGNPGYYTEMGLIQEALGSPNRAVLWYRRAMDEGSSAAGVALGFLYERKGKRKVARRLYQEAAGKGEAHALYHLGQFYLNQNDIDNARFYLEEARQKGEEVAHMQAYLAMRDRDFVAARQLLDEASKLENPEVEIIRRMLDSIDRHARHARMPVIPE